MFEILSKVLFIGVSSNSSISIYFYTAVVNNLCDKGKNSLESSIVVFWFGTMVSTQLLFEDVAFSSLQSHLWVISFQIYHKLFYGSMVLIHCQSQLFIRNYKIMDDLKIG